MLATMGFGRTGHSSTRVIFGAAALGAMSQSRADTTLARVREWGINHIDTAASYGESEDRLRPWLADHRDEVFLATKTDARDGSAARAGLERSLHRMGVDHVDMIQLHNLVEEGDWRRAFASDGAVAALVAARDEGLVAHIGVTGHGLRIASMHRRSLDEFEFASVLLPLNYSLMNEPGYRADFDDLLGVCRERNVAVQTIKSIARGRWSDPAARKFSWYEPLIDPGAIDRATRWVLGNPQVFLNTTSDARLLEPIVAAAQMVDAGEPRPSDAEMQADAAEFGISPLFDGADLERI